MFDVRLRLYTPDGKKSRVLKTLTLDHTGVASASGQLHFTVSTRVAGFLEFPFLVAVEYTTGPSTAWVQPRNGLFIVPQDDGDDADPAKVVSFTAQDLVSWLLGKAVLDWSYTIKDDQRPWKNASAGQIIWAMMTEAKNRGWGPLVSWDFSAAKDSNGQSWPSGDKITASYQIGTPISSVLASLSDQGLCEWWAEGARLRLFKPGTGTDLTALRFGGAGFTRIPIKTDANNVFTDLLVKAEKIPGVLHYRNAGADTRLGRLEAMQTQSGVDKKTTADRLAAPVLADGRTATREQSYEWTVADQMPRPWQDFNIGDLVTARSRTGGWEPLRVIGTVVTKDQDGVVTARLIAGSKILDLNAKLVKRTTAAVQGAIIGGTGTGFPSAGQVKADPLPPTGVRVVSNDGYFADDGTARARVTLAWTQVERSVQGADLDVDQYELWDRVPPAAGSRVSATSEATVTISTWESGVARKVKVRAKSAADVWGDFSTELDVTPAFPADVPDRPTAPTLTCAKRQITVYWDGNLTSGAPAAGFDHVVALARKAGGEFAPVAGAFSRGSVNFDAASLGAAIGDTVEVQLYAVNSLGVSSIGSDIASIVVTGVEGPDLEANSVTANAIEVGAVQAQHLSLSAVPPVGNPINRVPQVVTDSAFWGMVISGERPLYDIATARQHVAASAGGIVLIPTPTEFARIGVTARVPVPATMKVHVRWQATAAVKVSIYGFDTNFTYVGAASATGISGSALLTVPAGSAVYYTAVEIAAAGAAATLLMVQSFEVIGNGDLQHAELSPQGLVLYDPTGTPAVLLSTATSTLLTINQLAANGDIVPVAQIDDDGGAAFQTIDMSGDISFPTGDLVGAFGDITYNGQAIDTPFLERGPRGVIYQAGLGVDAGGRLIVAANAQYQALGSGQATFDPGRLYKVGFDSVFIRRWMSGAPTSSLVLEVWIGSGAQNVGSPNSTNGVLLRWPLLEADFTVNDGLSTGMQASRPVQLSGVLNILVRVTNPSGTPYQLYNLDVEPNLVIEDAGPVIDAINGGSIRNRAQSGAAAPVNAQPSTKVFNAIWSTLWDSGGNQLGAGGSLYADGRMVQGGNTGRRAGQIGFPALGLAGRVATGMWVRMKNRHAGAPVVGVDLGTHGNASAPAGGAPNLANLFTRNWSRGADGWVAIPSSLWAGFLNGTYRGIQIGGPNVNSGAGDYAIFDGYSTVNAVTNAGVRPQLKVSYK